MNKTAIVLVTIVGLSILAFLVMHYVAGFPVRKSAIIAGGAAAAMIIFDVIGVGRRKRVL